MSERRPVGRVVRALALVLALFASGAGVISACDSSTEPAPALTVDPGPTFGIEVTIRVSGNGRVVSSPLALDCPSNCFARLTSADRDFDSSDIGMTLSATAGVGWHFVGWSSQPFVSGTRAQGPAACSPMTRNAIGPPIGPSDDTVILPYGETQGTPPKGLEAECASYTTVPVAFSLVATFAEDPPQPFFGDDAAPPGEVLFEPPALGVIVAREIGLHGDTLYLRYDENGVTSTIVSGLKNGASGLSPVIHSTGSTFRVVSIGPNLAAQDQDGNIQTLNLTTLQRGMQFFGNSCEALPTDDTSAYCRYNSGTQGSVFILKLDGTGYRFLNLLPFGSDLAVDDTSLFFTDVQPDFANGSTLETSSKDASAVLDASRLVPNVSNPTHLVATATELVWLDIDEMTGPSILSHAPKTGAESAATYNLFTPIIALVVDPTDAHTFYAASTSSIATGPAQIYRYRTDTSSSTVVLSGMDSVNGLAADEVYLYWTQNDGRVYRAPK